MNPLSSLLQLFLPRVCAGCHRPLLPNEDTLCLTCRVQLNYLHDVKRGNPVERRLLRLFPFERGAAFCYYEHEALFARLIKKAKYESQPYINSGLTRLFLPELDRADWRGDIEVIVPMPVHWTRRLRRGYNQVEPIATELGRHWQLPVETRCLVKAHRTRSQVGQSQQERLQHFEHHLPFALRHTDRLQGRHVLLVDDVHTTGATLTAAARTLLQVPGIRLSFLTLGLTL